MEVINLRTKIAIRLSPEQMIESQTLLGEPDPQASMDMIGYQVHAVLRVNPSTWFELGDPIRLHIRITDIVSVQPEEEP